MNIRSRWNQGLMVLACAMAPDGFARAQSFCMPGYQGCMSCPCGNPPAGQGPGCNNSANTGGAIISANGPGYLSADAIVITIHGGMPTSSCQLVEALAPNVPGLSLGDGVFCLHVGWHRVGRARAAVGGTYFYPGPGEPSISAWDASHSAGITPNTSRYYQVVYRDPDPSYACAGGMLNMSSGEAVFWFP
jgi:hypothetical protein